MPRESRPSRKPTPRGTGSRKPGGADPFAQDEHRRLVESVRAIFWRSDPTTFQFHFVSREAEARYSEDPSKERTLIWLREREGQSSAVRSSSDTNGCGARLP